MTMILRIMTFRFTKKICLLLFLAFGLQACAQKSFKEMADDMAGDRAPIILLAQFDNNAVIVDTREKAEYDVSHIPGAIWVGDDISKMNGISKDKKIIVYCSVGYRSGKYAAKLREQGYTQAYNLWGGIFNWVNVGKELEDEKGPTNKIHGFNKKWGKWVSKGVVVYE